MRRKIFFAIVAIAVVAAAVWEIAGDRLVAAAMRRQVLRNLSGAAFAEMTDGLTWCCAAPARRCRIRRARSCVLVIADSA